MDTGKSQSLKEDGTTRRIDCCSTDLAALFRTGLFVCFESGDQREEKTPSVSRLSCLVVLLPLGSFPVSH